MSCRCAAFRSLAYDSVVDGVAWGEASDLMEEPVLLRRAPPNAMSLYRCSGCGTHWAEACFSSGHMEVYYLFPAPLDDAERWFDEQAAELPWDARAARRTVKTPPTT